MPSSSNPNTTSRLKFAERAKKHQKERKKKAYAAKLERKFNITKAETRRGARPGLRPTSGSGAALSKKKQRKLEKKMGYALKRQREGEGEVEMTDANTTKKKGANKAGIDVMDVDGGEIS